MDFARPGGGRFSLGPVALVAMIRHAQDDAEKPEAGGVLLGRHILDSQDIVVDRVTTPQQGDRQGRFLFFRAQHRHQQLIDAAWRESHGTRTYLGEWHTHPELVPQPSVIDRVNWRRKLLVDCFSAPIFFLIVGTGDVGVWEGRRCRPVTPLQRL